MANEKEIMLRDWELLDDEQVVKNAATKGKFINSCIKFLAERQGVSTVSAKKYFFRQVVRYVERLLNNRQIHKAEHVLENVGFSSKNVFFEISKESSDADLREYLVEHFKQNFDDFESNLMSLEEEWFLFNNLKVHLETLVAEFGSDLNEFNFSFFDQFCRIPKELKDEIVTFTFFKTQDLLLTSYLKRERFLEFLIRTKNYYQIKMWANGIVTKEADSFQATLEILYGRWSIDQNMLDVLQEKLFYTNTILYGFARKGCFFGNEALDFHKILHRIVTVGALAANESVLARPEHQRALFNWMTSQDLSHLIACGVFSASFLHEISKYGAPMHEQARAYLQIGSLFDPKLTVEGLLRVSTGMSEYLAEKKEGPDMSDFLENILENVGIEEIKPSIPGNFLHMRAFLTEAFVPPEDIDILYLIRRYLSLDVEEIRETTFDVETEFTPSFNLKKALDSEIYPSKLSYLHYIKQQRSAYAVYVFCIEQLRQFGKISRTHILIAAENVTELAMANITDEILSVHCIAFIECLGIDTSRIRALIRCLRKLGQVEPERVSGSLSLHHITEDVFTKVIQVYNVDEHILNLEALKLITIGKCSLFLDGLTQLLSREESWYKILLICQYLGLSTEQLMSVVKQLQNRLVRRNLILAINYDRCDQFGRRNSRHYRKWRRSYSRQKSDNGDQQKPLSLLNEENWDLMKVVLNIPSTEPRFPSFSSFIDHLLNPQSVDFISYAWTKSWAVFVLLAAVKYQDINQNYLWLLWLMISIEFDRSKLTSYETFNQLSADVIFYAIGHGFTETFSICTKVFYSNSAFAYFAQFLEISWKNCRQTEALELLKRYLLVLNSDDFSPIQFSQRADALAFSANILLLHIEHNFTTPFERLCLLDQLGEIGHFEEYVNFALMRDVYRILDGTGVQVKSELFVKKTDPTIVQAHVEAIWNELKTLELYEKAIQVAKKFDLSVSSIILDAWKRQYASEEGLTPERCEKDVEEYELKHEILIAFYLSISNELAAGTREKYLWIKHALDVMQLHSLYHLDWVDLDQLENQLIHAYVKADASEALPVHHSAYHQNVMTHENFVLFSTLADLRVIAAIEDITVNSVEMSAGEKGKLLELINVLLDKSDIVQALRYQQMFGCKTTDLHHVVFAMELAENITPLHRISVEERKTLMNVGTRGVSKSSRRTLMSPRYSTTSASSSSPNRPNYLQDSSDTSGYEFEEIPSREKQDTKEILQNISARAKHGSQILDRIVQLYRASMYMDQPYELILKRKDPFAILNDVTNIDCLNKLAVISDLITAAKMTSDEIASFLSNQLAESVIKSRFYLFQGGPALTSVKNSLWGFDLDSQFHLILELCHPHNTLFGNYLLYYYEGLNIYRQPSIYTERKNLRLNLVITNIGCILQDKILSQKKQNTIQIELLIKAHQCFLHDCSVEGISEVLQKAKTLVSILAAAKSWSLIIRLLTGLGRYKEMFYCFDILVSNEQFMPLIKKCAEENRKNLQSAIISYLREHYPNNKHYFETAAAYFAMYSDLAGLYAADAEQILSNMMNMHLKNVAVSSKSDKDVYHVGYIKGSKETLQVLHSAMEYYSSAAELYLLDNKLTQAQGVTGKAEIIALQICLINQGYSKHGCLCVLRVENDHKLFSYLVTCQLSVPQAVILSRGTTINVEWSRAIYEQYVIRGDEQYLIDFLDRLPFTEAILDDIYKLYMLEPKSTSANLRAMMRLISYHHTVADKYVLRKN